MECVKPITGLEGCLRSIANEKGIRPSEYFLDFDKLRHGKITVDRFFRVLDRNFGFKANDEQKKLMIEKYGQDGYMDWRKFVECIDPSIDERKVSVFPQDQLQQFDSDLMLNCPQMANVDYEAYRPILSRINQFMKAKGIDLRECYRDFDSLNSGRINESQFYRNFPGPPDITSAEKCALAKRYSVLNCPGTVDYRRLQSDILQLDKQEEIAKHGQPELEVTRDTRVISNDDLQAPSVQQILEHIGFEVYKNGIRVLDFFIDFDPLRHDEVTENQFKLALGRALRDEIQPCDVQQLINFYRSKKNPNMVAYRQFCREVDFHFHEMDLEKRPLVEPLMPYPGAMSKPLKILRDQDVVEISELITRLREKVKRERIPTYQYFRDYDGGSALSRKITPNQLARILHFLGLSVTTEQCKLLARKFADPTPGFVNYAALCEAIDPTFKARAPVPQVMEDPPPPQPIPAIGEAPKVPQKADWAALSTPRAVSSGDNVPVDILMKRICHIVLVNRIQLKPFFEDYDPLRSGRISRTQFGRALSNGTFTRLGKHDLTPMQLDKLADAFACPEDVSKVNWKLFLDDIDRVFTLPEIEQKPLLRVQPSSVHLIPAPGTGDWNTATEEMKDRCERAMRQLRRSLLERRIDMKTEFKAFDKTNRGHVTRHNLIQIFSSLNFNLSDDRIDAIAARYADDDGFNYRRFLADLEPPSDEQLYYDYPERIARMRRVYVESQATKESEQIICDVEGIMDHIKRLVFEHRIRLSDWFRDHDPLRHGKISRLSFRRALSLLPIPLKETEISCIEHYFKADQDDAVRWKDFCEEIESIFATPHLEKDPLKPIQVYKLQSPVSRNCLSVELAETADAAMKKIARMMREKRTQLTQWFGDFDKTHRMTISGNQFRRVLTNLGVAKDLSRQEWDALFARYRHPVGQIDDVNYLAFSDDVFKLAGMQFRIP